MPKLNDQQMITDLLLGSKALSSTYNLAILESANPPVRDAFYRLYTDEINAVKNIFDAMNHRGWYPTEPAFTATPGQMRMPPEQPRAY